MLVLSLVLAGRAGAQEFYFGNDLSYVNEMEDCGAVYRENGIAKDPYRIFADHGSNLVRVRLWVDPSWWQAPLQQPAGVKPAYGDFEDVHETIRRAKDAGMEVLLDFHYSDFWADPGRQLVPHRWESVAYNLTALEDSIYQYTRDVLTALDADGLMPELVQVGNETTNGLLRQIAAPGSFEPSETVSNSWARHARLFNAAIRAVREVGASSTIDPRIAIHLAGGLSGYLWRFYSNFLANGVTDFDIMGISYYYAWHGGSIEELEYEVADMATTYPDYDIMVLETAYPWTRRNFDSLGNIVTDPDPHYLPVSPGKQLEYLTDYARAVMRAGGKGVVFWEPAWVSTPCRTAWGRGSSHDHLVFFDPYTTNFMEDGGGHWMEPRFYEDLDAPKVIFKVDMTGQDVSGGVYIEGDFGVDAGQPVPMAELENDVYYYYAYLPDGTTGTFRFLKGSAGSEPESVPSACAAPGTDARPFSVSSGGDEFDFVWGSCATNVGIEAGLPALGPLLDAYPNPFRSVATVSYLLPAASYVDLAVFDLTGRRMETLVSGVRAAGRHEALLDGTALPTGLYLCRLTRDGSSSVSRVLVLQ